MAGWCCGAVRLGGRAPPAAPPKRRAPSSPTSRRARARAMRVTASSATAPHPFSAIDRESSTAMTTCARRTDPGRDASLAAAHPSSLLPVTCGSKSSDRWPAPSHLVLALVGVGAPHPDLVAPEVARNKGDDLLHVDALACRGQPPTSDSRVARQGPHPVGSPPSAATRTRWAGN